MAKATTKKPGVVESIVNAVDHMIHPDATPTPAEQDSATPAADDKKPAAVKTKNAGPEFQGHSKFDKFN